MPPQMMMQLGQTSITSKNGWNSMLTQNLQPVPGNKLFFNLTAIKSLHSLLLRNQPST
ncbi:unnamed protein product [Lasius platythorax]|uniref:Uncharacterized protein n=1 Tax=Lasius platythorax TaxID=488582 RepID=A0AAV2NC88_9HYME